MAISAFGMLRVNLNLWSAFNIINFWTNDAFIFQVFNEDWCLVGDNLWFSGCTKDSFVERLTLSESFSRLQKEFQPSL